LYSNHNSIELLKTNDLQLSDEDTPGFKKSSNKKSEKQKPRLTEPKIFTEDSFSIKNKKDEIKKNLSLVKDLKRRNKVINSLTESGKSKFVER